MANFTYPEVFATESLAQQTFYDNISGASPVMAVLFDRLCNSKRPLDVAVKPMSQPYGGSFAVCPVALALGQGEGVTRSGQYTAMSVSGSSDGDVDYAKYKYSSYRTFYRVGTREEFLQQGGPNQRMDIHEAETVRCVGKLVNLMTGHLDGNAVEAEDALMGLQYALSTGNTVGGIAQGSVAAWQSNVRAVNAALTATHLIDAITDSQRVSYQYGNEQADLILLAQHSSSRLYSSILSTIAGKTLVPATNALVKYGPSLVQFHGAYLLPWKQTSASASGLVMGLNMDTWFWSGDLAPRPLTPTRPSGTNTTEYGWVWQGSLGCASPGTGNFKLTGCT